MFQTKTRDNGETFVTLADDAPAWLRQAVQDAHLDEVPNDWRYAMCERLWAGIEEAGAVGEVDDDALMELADGLVPAYTNERTAWLAGNLDRTADVDEVLDEGVWEKSQGIAGLIGAAMYRSIEAMAVILRDARDEHADLADDDARAMA